MKRQAASAILTSAARQATAKKVKMQIKGKPPKRRTTTVWRFRAEEPPFSQIAKVICGRAFVSMNMRPVSTPSLRSVGHSPHVHGTQAQFYLATSPYLYVVCNVCAQDKMQKAVCTERQVAPSWGYLI